MLKPYGLLAVMFFSAMGPMGMAGSTAQNPTDTSWTPTTITPMELAKRVDHTLNTLSGVSMDYVYSFNLDVGRGTFPGLAGAESADKVRIEYPLVGTTERDALRRETVVKNGSKVTFITEDAKGGAFFRATRPTFSPQLPANLLLAWNRGNIKYLLSAIQSGEKPLEALVQAAMSNKEFDVFSQTREIPYQDLTAHKESFIRQYHIVVARKKSVADVKGGLFYEIIIGDKYFFPISMNNLSSKGKKRFMTVMSKTRWKTSKNQKWTLDFFNSRVPHFVPRKTSKGK